MILPLCNLVNLAPILPWNVLMCPVSTYNGMISKSLDSSWNWFLFHGQSCKLAYYINILLFSIVLPQSLVTNDAACVAPSVCSCKALQPKS